MRFSLLSVAAAATLLAGATQVQAAHRHAARHDRRRGAGADAASDFDHRHRAHRARALQRFQFSKK